MLLCRHSTVLERVVSERTPSLNFVFETICEKQQSFFWFKQVVELVKYVVKVVKEKKPTTRDFGSLESQSPSSIFSLCLFFLSHFPDA